MNENQIKALPRNVLEHYRAIPDSFFDDDEDLGEARGRLAASNHAQQMAVEELVYVRQRVAEILGMRSELLAKIESMQRDRPDQLAKSLLDDCNLSTDQDLTAEIADLQYRADAISIAEPALERQIEALQRDVSAAGSRVLNDEETLAASIDILRLAEAERRAYG